jgi:hypothetical protein
MPFREENTVIMIYGSAPSGRHHVSNLIPMAPTHCGWGHGGSGV